jgi:hypothetical protein
MGNELVNQTIGDKIFKMRQVLGLTQEGLGGLAPISTEHH